MKATLRRLQELETRRSAQIAATDPSGAREELRARINRMAERWRANPEWESLPKPTGAEVQAQIQAVLSRIGS
jgi:hypothetical protein